MYLLQKIDVNLTKENADILKKPSKVFNSIKAIFQGGLTPTQERQAEVMLSFLQRLNVALRQCNFDRLASVAVNDKIVYESNDGDSFEDGREVLKSGFSSGEITKVNTLALTVDAVKGRLNYLIHVSLVRKPKVGVSPINIQIFGFINEFRRDDGEDRDMFSTRVKSMIASNWGSKKERAKRLSELEKEFTAEVSTLQVKIDELFPMKSTIADLRRSVKEKSFRSSSAYHNERYDDTYLYLPFFFESFDDVDYEDEGYELDRMESWDNDILYYDSSSASGWGSFESADSSSDSSSCGSSCGGGCGGS